MFNRVRPNPRARLATITAVDRGTNRRDQNRRPGPISATGLSCGFVQLRYEGYMPYAHNIAIALPSTPPNPSSRSGFAWTNSKLPNPSDAQTMDQNEAGNVMRRAAVARSSAVFPVR